MGESNGNLIHITLRHEPQGWQVQEKGQNSQKIKKRVRKEKKKDTFRSFFAKKKDGSDVRTRRKPEKTNKEGVNALPKTQREGDK